MASDSGVGQDDTVELEPTTGEDVVVVENSDVATTSTEQEVASVVVAPDRALDVDLVALLNGTVRRSLIIVNNQADYETLQWELHRDNPKGLQVALKTTSKFRFKIASR